ncbi:hypothetical protein [Actinokineospora sp. NBRC 105648]|uniref:hypothetical protein n=1 Tax=Actinokineospora sp. NBRC 105648 TaxID=3032206 RepID=UPI0024A4A044|nr:hypothetical protein [Actinokineospora sp. NBRC 105648]GLZ39240.1 hypothetical protein Acsp05_28640 [Actinokineospora sp. NBRC 105648]
MEFGYFLHQVVATRSSSRVDWLPVAIKPVPLDQNALDSAETTAAIDGMVPWALTQLAENRDHYALFHISLATVDEEGDADRTLAETYRLLHEGDTVPTGTTVDCRDYFPFPRPSLASCTNS